MPIDAIRAIRVGILHHGLNRYRTGFATGRINAS